ncbi:endonuclease/exonuclease/phosphatase family protein [Harenicola maris]|uniref:endonuclease/exonuclease/phosphatase family protein n=1 Tax=Harenicola maris TaxID=2841044 RepID=UPI002E18AC11
MRDIAKGDDPQIAAVSAVIAHAEADVLLLTNLDYDDKQEALTALQETLAAAGAPYPHAFADWPNAGLRTGMDMDGDGKVNTGRDTQGFGRFSGAGGMAVLSRHPLTLTHDFTPLLWRDLPGAGDLPALMPAPAWQVQRLSSVNHWAIRVEAPTPFTLLTLAATPPVFDGPEDRNGHRNAAELALLHMYLDGQLNTPAPQGPVVIAGNLNLDAYDGDGRPNALNALLQSGHIQDPAPSSQGGAAEADPTHKGPPALDTADFNDPPGNLRADYVLPDATAKVLDAGVIWPAPDAQGSGPTLEQVQTASRHRLVWVEIELPAQGQ